MKKRQSYFSKLIDINPDHGKANLYLNRICNELGIKFHKEGKHKEALKYFKVVTILEPKECLGFYNMGNTYLELEDFKNAKVYFETALRVDPKYELATGNLGIVYRKWEN